MLPGIHGESHLRHSELQRGELAAGDTWNDFGSVNYAPLPAGQYYIEITQGYWSSEDTRYTLSVSGTPALALPPSRCVEPPAWSEVRLWPDPASAPSPRPVVGCIGPEMPPPPGGLSIAIGDTCSPERRGVG